MHVTITDGSFSFGGQATYRVNCVADAASNLVTLLKPSCTFVKMSGGLVHYEEPLEHEIKVHQSFTDGTGYSQGFKVTHSTSICRWDAAQQHRERGPYGTALLGNGHSIAREKVKTQILQSDAVQEHSVGSLRL